MNVFLLLGTNLGDRNKNLAVAREALAAEAGTILKRSGIYQTDAWGKTDQPSFYNQVVQLETTLSSQALLNVALSVEKKMGRTRTLRWGERIIDIDILFYGDEIVDTSDLIIPHPQLANRKFTLVPLEELAPDLVHPVLHKTITDLLLECKDDLNVIRLPD